MVRIDGLSIYLFSYNMIGALVCMAYYDLIWYHIMIWCNPSYAALYCMIALISVILHRLRTPMNAAMQDHFITYCGGEMIWLQWLDVILRNFSTLHRFKVSQLLLRYFVIGMNLRAMDYTADGLVAHSRVFWINYVLFAFVYQKMEQWDNGESKKF